MGQLIKLLLIFTAITVHLEAKKKICFIVNPISGVGKQNIVEKLIKKNLNHNEFTYEICYSKYNKHAKKLSSQAILNGAQIIVAVGGDGSVNEIAQGMIGSNAALGIIPTGSGNGFARHFKIPKDPTEAIKIINNCYEKWIDTVKINDESYLGVAGVGFDADVSLAFSNLEKRGLSSYLKIILNKITHYKAQKYQLIIDGKPYTRKAFLICFANSQQYGNNAFIAPKAEIDDGYLDVIIWRAFPKHATPKLLHDLFSKHLDNSKYTETFRCQEVILNRPMKTLHIDGEPLNVMDDVYIRVLPSSLKIIAPIS